MLHPRFAISSRCGSVIDPSTIEVIPEAGREYAWVIYQPQNDDLL